MEFLPTSRDDMAAMLAALGLNSVDELFERAIPPEARLARPLDLPEPLSEQELVAAFEERAAADAPARGFRSFLGGGVYHHFVPAVVRFVASLPEFYTAYTPYQPEVSQGTLASIFEFQTMICELTGLDVANASLYDGATAVVEAARVALRRRPGRPVLVSPYLHPHALAALETYLAPLGVELAHLPADAARGTTLPLEPGSEPAAVIVQNPNYLGNVEDIAAHAAAARGVGALTVAVSDPIALGLFEAPGALGADVCVGEAQGAGIAPSFGGPLLGFMAARQEFVRDLPGRIVGESVDANGDRCFVLTLQTREQHIRREKASSNICSNEALCALMATVHLSWLGPRGLSGLARAIYAKTVFARDLFARAGAAPLFPETPSFRDTAVRLPVPYERALPAFLEARILPGIPLARYFPWASDRDILVTVTEMNSRRDIEAYARVLEALS